MTVTVSIQDTMFKQGKPILNSNKVMYTCDNFACKPPCLLSNDLRCGQGFGKAF